MEDPETLRKIVPIAGDITLPELGISEADQKMLTDEVSVVFHSAATVKFDEKLKLSINVNVQGTKRIVELCKRMKHLVVSELCIFSITPGMELL
jgi:fatty acyl-CoA reductase